MFDPARDTVLNVLLEHVRLNPSFPFLSIAPDRSLSYAESYTLVNTLCRKLQEHLSGLGAEHPPRVAIVSANNLLYPLVLWATWLCGAVAVPLSRNANPELWWSMLEVAKVDIVLVSNSARAALLRGGTPRSGVPVIPLSSFQPELQHQTEDDTSLREQYEAFSSWKTHSATPTLTICDTPTARSSDPAIVLFTSSAVDASTLKCILYSHSTLVHSANRTLTSFGGPDYAKEPKRHLGWLPLSHAFEFTIGLLGVVIWTGGTYVLHDPTISCPDSPSTTLLSERLFMSLRYHQPIHSFFIIPATLEEVYDSLSLEELGLLRSLDSLCVAGAAPSTDLLDWLQRKSIKAINLVGATEVAGGICTQGPFTWDSGMKMMDGLMGIIEKSSSEDDHGELIVAGQYLPSRYEFGQSDAYWIDSASGIPVYRTGDLYRCGPNFRGYCVVRGDTPPAVNMEYIAASDIYYIGRIDDMIILNNGYKVDGSSLERQLDSFPGIRKSALLASPQGDSVVAVIEPRPEYRSRKEDIVKAVLSINRILPIEKRIHPKNIISISSMPMTSKLTIHRKQIRHMLKSRSSSEQQEAELVPRTLERTPADVSHIDRNLRSQVELVLADVLQVALEDIQNPTFILSDIPISSLLSVRLAKAIKDHFHCDFPQSKFYGIRSTADLCHLITGWSNMSAIPATAQSTPASSIDTARKSRTVISGMACRFSGGINSPDALWTVLLSPDQYAAALGRSAPASRWDSGIQDASLPMGWLDDPSLDDVQSFSSFFKIPPSVVEAMTPNSRLVMQLGYSALEDAGIAPRTLSGRRWAVFTSLNESGWRQKLLSLHDVEEYGKLWSVAADDAAGARLAYFLNLTGPCMEIKTACSSSAVAVHQACRAIQAGDCEAALVISSTTHFHPSAAIFRLTAGIGSPSGKCTPFCDEADGFLPSEGAAAIVIQKEYSTSTIPYIRIRGSAVCHDGRSQGFSAPNPVAQAAVIGQALQNAHCSPTDIDYFEAHGTGTPVGDAIEIDAINRVYGGKRERPLFLGSIKAVIGHVEECAGLASILKVALCHTNRLIPAQPSTGILNESLDLRTSNIVPVQITEHFGNTTRPKLSAVSSFGLSGTLAHIIFEDFGPTVDLPEIAAHETGQRALLFLVSAHSPDHFIARVKSYLGFLRSGRAQKSRFYEICRTTQACRDHFPYRRCCSVKNLNEIVRHLSSVLSSVPSLAARNPSVTICFSLPHGSMLLPEAGIPAYSRVLADDVDPGLRPELGYLLRQFALAKALQDLGCPIRAVCGEGSGEYMAAAFSGILDLRTALQCLRKLSPGSPRVCILHQSRESAEDILLNYRPDELQIRGICGPNRIALSGSEGALSALEEEVGREAITEASWLVQSYTEDRDTFAVSRGTLPMYSSYLMEEIGLEADAHSTYWSTLAARTYDMDRLTQILGSRGDVVLDLCSASLMKSSSGDALVLDFQDGLEGVLGHLYEIGCSIEWHALDPSPVQAVRLPTYPWTV